MGNRSSSYQNIEKVPTFQMTTMNVWMFTFLESSPSAPIRNQVRRKVAKGVIIKRRGNRIQHISCEEHGRFRNPGGSNIGGENEGLQFDLSDCLFNKKRKGGRDR